MKTRVVWKVAGTALAVAAVSVVAGCSSSDKTAEPPARTPQVDAIRTLLTPIAEAQCQHWFDCCTDGERILQTGEPMKDVPACTDVLVEMSEHAATQPNFYGSPLPAPLQLMKYLEYGFDFSRVDPDQAAIAACAKSLSAASCTQVRPPDHCVPNPAPVTDDPCTVHELFVGKQQDGDDCVTNSGSGTDGVECAPGLECVAADAIHGVCVPVPKDGALCAQDYDCRGGTVCNETLGRCVHGLGVGADCAYADPDHPVRGTETSPCASGLICDTQTLKCTDAACAAGTSCSADASCPTGLHCVGGACGPLGKPGQFCYSNGECESGSCGTSPGGGGNVCLPRRAIGAPCTSGQDCESHSCSTPTLSTPGTCTAALLPGQPCLPGQSGVCAGGHCLFDAATGAATCVAAGAAGATCATNVDCDTGASLWCVKGVCSKPPFPDGGPCSDDGSCISNFCSTGVCVARAKAAEPCSSASSAGGPPPCQDGLYCDFSDLSLPSGTCRSVKRAGDPCSTSQECTNDCVPVGGELRCVDYDGRASICTGPAAI